MSLAQDQRDDSQALLHKQSHCFYDVTRIYLNNLVATNVANTGVFNQNINKSNLEAGIYLVSIAEGDYKTVKRIIIQ